MPELRTAGMVGSRANQTRQRAHYVHAPPALSILFRPCKGRAIRWPGGRLSLGRFNHRSMFILTFAVARIYDRADRVPARYPRPGGAPHELDPGIRSRSAIGGSRRSIAALPIIVLFTLLAGLKVKPHWCAIAGASTAVSSAFLSSTCRPHSRHHRLLPTASRSAS